MLCAIGTVPMSRRHGVGIVGIAAHRGNFNGSRPKWHRERSDRKCIISWSRWRARERREFSTGDMGLALPQLRQPWPKLKQAWRSFAGGVIPPVSSVCSISSPLRGTYFFALGLTRRRPDFGQLAFRYLGQNLDQNIGFALKMNMARCYFARHLS